MPLPPAETENVSVIQSPKAESEAVSPELAEVKGPVRTKVWKIRNTLLKNYLQFFFNCELFWIPSSSTNSDRLRPKEMKSLRHTDNVDKKNWWKLKPLSVRTSVVGLQTDDAGHVCQNSSAHVARVVTETCLNEILDRTLII